MESRIKNLSDGTPIAIYGAGIIGCFISALLIRAGRRVTLLTRPRIAAELSSHGLRATDFAGVDIQLPPDALDLRTSPDFLRDTGLVLLTVKGGGTAAAAKEIGGLTPSGVKVLSLQNGVENAAILRAVLGNDRVLGGMVAFNVIHKGEGHFHRASSGGIVIEDGSPCVLPLLGVQDFNISVSPNITGVQWGKLLLNLSNGLNALAGLPLRQQFEERAWRLLLAEQIEEALEALKAGGIKPVPANNVPPRLLPHILRLPDALFRIVARPMLKIDPQARTSMWEDLTLRRRTEVDYIQGAVIRLARKHGIEAPLCEKVLFLVKEAERAAAGPPGLSPASIQRSF